MEYSSKDIRNIAFEKINDRFSKGNYLGVEVTIDMTTGYVNGPHLVRQVKGRNGNPKRFDHWRETAECTRMVEYLTPVVAGVADKLIVDVTDAPNGLRGAYIHPRLVVHAAMWASPTFADKVAIIMNDRAISEAVASRDKEIVSLKETLANIQAQNDKIIAQNNEHKSTIDDQSRQIAELLGYAKETKSTLDHVVVQNDSLLREARETSIAVECLEYQVERATESIDTILPNKTVTPPSKSIQYFCLYSHATTTTRFYAVRGQQTNLDRARPKLISAGYVLEPIYSREDPNPFHSFNTLKRLLDEGARALLQQKRARGRYTLKNAIEEFGSYHLNVITCSRNRLDSLLEELDRLRAAMDQ